LEKGYTSGSSKKIPINLRGGRTPGAEGGCWWGTLDTDSKERLSQKSLNGAWGGVCDGLQSTLGGALCKSKEKLVGAISERNGID